MAYEPKLNLRRGAMTERLGFTRQDIDLVKRILNENDEVVIAICGSERSHEREEKNPNDERNYLMSGGERIDVAQYALKNEGIDPARCIVVPVKNDPANTNWASDVKMLTPRWEKLYTGNYKNASIFEKLRRRHGYEVIRFDEQRPQKDFFEIWARALKGERVAGQELQLYFPESAIERMKEMGIDKRVDSIYNRRNVSENPKNPKRALFLGRIQPLTGVYEHGNGHIGNIKRGLESADEVVIAIGSAQKSDREDNPLTSGQRLEIIRYALLKNGVDASRFYIIPVKDIPEDFIFPDETITLSPEFGMIIAGNDWTKQLFGKGNYQVIPVVRDKSSKGREISGTYIRNTAFDILKKSHKKGEQVSTETIEKIEKDLGDMMDPSTLEILRYIGYYDTMAFLAFAKE
jgi:nicotinamide-nucleotide adenylyltransferase